jgi:hypothetical protein
MQYRVPWGIIVGVEVPDEDTPSIVILPDALTLTAPTVVADDLAVNVFEPVACEVAVP